jgi:hypothetical protein
MNENKRNIDQGRNKARREGDSIGNKQNTTQTGAQNSGGKNRDQREDMYDQDLHRSNERKRSDQGR